MQPCPACPHKETMPVHGLSGYLSLTRLARNINPQPFTLDPTSPAHPPPPSLLSFQSLCPLTLEALSTETPQHWFPLRTPDSKSRIKLRQWACSPSGFGSSRFPPRSLTNLESRPAALQSTTAGSGRRGGLLMRQDEPQISRTVWCWTVEHAE